MPQPKANFGTKYMSHALERVRVWVVFIISISLSFRPIHHIMLSRWFALNLNCSSFFFSALVRWNLISYHFLSSSWKWKKKKNQQPQPKNNKETPSQCMRTCEKLHKISVYCVVKWTFEVFQAIQFLELYK